MKYKIIEKIGFKIAIIYVYQSLPKWQWTKCSNQKTEMGRLYKNQDPTICYLQETHFKTKDTYLLKVRERKKVFHTNGNDKKAGSQYSYQTK